MGWSSKRGVRLCLSGIRIKVLQHGGSCAGDIRASDERDLVGCEHAGDAQLAGGGRLLEEILEDVLCVCHTRW